MERTRGATLATVLALLLVSSTFFVSESSFRKGPSGRLYPVADASTMQCSAAVACPPRFHRVCTLIVQEQAQSYLASHPTSHCDPPSVCAPNSLPDTSPSRAASKRDLFRGRVVDRPRFRPLRAEPPKERRLCPCGRLVRCDRAKNVL